MKIRILAMALTFIIGLIAAKLWLGYHSPARQTSVLGVKKTSETESSARPPRFTGGEFRSAFKDHYFSSDGAHIRYGCFEVSTAARAAYWLRKTVGSAREVERGPKSNDKGEAIGTRVVVRNPADAEPDAASIYWTEGPRKFTIHAPSLKLALEFEEWMAASKYRTQHCYNFSGVQPADARPRRRTTH